MEDSVDSIQDPGRHTSVALDTTAAVGDLLDRLTEVMNEFTEMNELTE